MLTRLDIITPPAMPLVDVNLLKQAVRVTNTVDDALLVSYIDVCTQYDQQYLNRALLTQTLQWTIAKSQPNSSYQLQNAPWYLFQPFAWPFVMNLNNNVMELPRSPVQSVTTITYGVWGQSDTTLTLGTDYDVDLISQPARVNLHVQNQPCPPDHYCFTYIAGYGNSPSDVPSPIVNAVMMAAGYMYQYQQDPEATMPKWVYTQLDPYRLQTFA